MRKPHGSATRCLIHHSGVEFGVSVISMLEFLEGYEHPGDAERFLSPFPVPVTTEVARIGSRIRPDLRQRGEMIGDFDILIAATALEARSALVTDNTRHFKRIVGLVVEGYRD